MLDVKVKVEYCGSCGYKRQFLDMVNKIKENVPTADVIGSNGRQASFEVHINDELVYSKLQTLAFPDFDAVSQVTKDVSEGKPIRQITKQQPITDCTIS